MRFYNSLYAKILLGYSVLGGLFILLVAGALFQFRSLKEQIAEQRQVSRFFDAVRYARRMEKNFLLFRKTADLNEAVLKAAQAADAYAALPMVIQSQADIAVDVLQYHALLRELLTNPRQRPSQEIQDELFAVGSRLLKAGEDFDELARDRLKKAVSGHEQDLLKAILVTSVLVVLAGALVTRRVVRPLREIEWRMRKIAGGESRLLESGEEDREVRSLTESINGALTELERRQAMVARSSRLVALGTMLSGVAHELNNPLSNISSSCQILQEELEELPPAESLALLGQIDEQVLRAQRIVSALLDFSRDRAFVRQREQVAELVADALRFVRAAIPDNVEVQMQIADDVCVEVERQRFQQVLVNLVKNAAEALPQGGYVRIVAVREAWHAGQPGTTITVEDNGQGIEAADLQRIFDPFFTTKPVGRGTGLGLFVAHEIVSQHGGQLTVDSEPGKMTRFSLHIPDGRHDAVAAGEG